MDGGSPSSIPTDVLDYAPPHFRLRRATIVLLLALSAYVGIYVFARATGQLVHYESVLIAERGGWWYGHEIAPGATAAPAPVLTCLRPLMRAEELLRGVADRLTP